VVWTWTDVEDTWTCDALRTKTGQERCTQINDVAQSDVNEHGFKPTFEIKFKFKFPFKTNLKLGRSGLPIRERMGRKM